MSQPEQREEAVFEAALQLPADQRAAYLDQTCAGDPETRRRVEALLGAFERAGGFLKDPAVATPARTVAISLSPTEKPGDRIGRYKLLEQIGEGGCGVVYVAEQEEPVRRRVALKVIKLGMDTKQVIARFDAERQALAMMDHPNIAKIYDAGATDAPLPASGHPLPSSDEGRGQGEGSQPPATRHSPPATLYGRPYFVMELVRGIKITDYCDQNHLAPRERLDLFTQVCRAIQHAHQKGVIHRDIKPSNILVTLHDGVPVPKVIDFGIAKATQGRLTDQTVYTAFEQFIGTPAYMSPEQAEMSGLDIDTRSDIYSLGVLLYELLTGTTPFDAKELLAAGLDEMRRTIREVEPVKPSTRLTQELVGDDVRRLTSKSETREAKSEEEIRVSSRRLLQTKDLIHLLRGDLDWIVMKCLEKDRTRRYETANGLATDISRHLNSEPVIARPPSAAYRFQKMVRRNKLAFGALVAVAAALVIGLGLAAWQYFEKSKAYNRALAAEKQAEHEALVSRQNLYAADVSLAQNAWEEGNLGQARKLLAAHWPKSGDTDLRGFEWRYFWKRAQGDQLHTLRGHSHPVNGVAFCPDGKTLASASADSTVKIWNLADQQIVATLSHPKAVYCLAFSIDGRTLATGSADQLVRFWDMATGELRSTMKPGGNPARLAFSPTGTLLAIGCGQPFHGDGGGTVVLWDYAAGREVNRFPNAGARIAFSPDGKFLASGSFNGAIELWDIAARRSVRALEKAGEVFSLTFSPDGRTLAVGNREGELQLWEAAAGHRIAELKRAPGQVCGVAFSPNGNTVAAANADGAVDLWSMPTRQVLATLRGHGNQVHAVAFSPDGKTLATGSTDETIMLWRATPKAEIEPIGEVVSPPVFSPDGKTLATDCMDNSVKFRDVTTGRTTAVFGGEAFVVAFSSDGKTLVTLSTNRSLRFWDVTSHAIHKTIPLSRKEERIGWTTLSPDGKTLATGGVDSRITTEKTQYTVTLWNAATGEVIGTLRSDDYVWNGVFSPDGRTFATACYNGTASIWTLATRQRRALLTGHKGTVRWVAFSPDGRTLATSSYDDTVKLWNVSTWKEVETLTGHRGSAFGLAFSPDGGTLAVCSGEGNVKLWNMATYREVATLRQWKAVGFVAFSDDGKAVATVNAASWVVFSPKGEYAATVYADGFVRLWNAPFPATTAETLP